MPLLLLTFKVWEFRDLIDWGVLEAVKPHMQIFGRFCSLVLACSVFEVHNRILRILVGMFIMDCASCLKFLTQGTDFGCGFLLFRYFSQVFHVVVLLFMLGFGLGVVQFGFNRKGLLQYLCDVRGKPSDLGSGIFSNRCLDEVCGVKTDSSHRCSTKFSEKPAPEKDPINGGSDLEVTNVADEEFNENGCCPEDEEFDVLELRKLVKMERRRVTKACRELEKERLAAASAVDETMAMIMRLQREKSSVEIEANQYRRMVEQKQEFDREVIQSLRWIVLKHESERSLLEGKLRSCRQRLKLYVEGDELEELEEIDAGSNFLGFNPEDVDETEPIRPTEMDL